MNDTQEKKSEITFKLNSFKVEHFLLHDFAKSEEQLNPDQVLFHHVGKAEVFVQKKQIAIRFDVKTEYLSKPLGEISTISVYEIVNFENFVIDNTIQIPKMVWIMLVGLAYSTTRGALIVKGEGTLLEKYPMPVVDPGKLIQIEKQ